MRAGTWIDRISAILDPGRVGAAGAVRRHDEPGAGIERRPQARLHVGGTGVLEQRRDRRGVEVDPVEREPGDRVAAIDGDSHGESGRAHRGQDGRPDVVHVEPCARARARRGAARSA